MTTHHKKNSHHASAAHPAKKAVPQHSAPTPESHSPVAVAAAGLNPNIQIVLIVALVVAAFFGAYRFAQASNANNVSTSPAVAGTSVPAAGGFFGAAGSAGSAGGDGCCGGGGGAPVEGAATVEGGVQKIDVDLSTGSYSPNVIKLKAGVPTEITFGASGGCTAQVQSGELGFAEDLTSGPKTVKLAALQAGTYGFACGMNMVTGQIVVE